MNLHQPTAVAVLGERVRLKGRPAEVVGVIETPGATLVTVRVDAATPAAGVLYCKCGLPGCPGNQATAAGLR